MKQPEDGGGNVPDESTSETIERLVGDLEELQELVMPYVDYLNEENQRAFLGSCGYARLVRFKLARDQIGEENEAPALDNLQSLSESLSALYWRARQHVGDQVVRSGKA